MKKILTILLALQLFTDNQFLAELVKIPSLIEHFQEHKALNAALDFFTFLKMHYGDPEHQKSDERHNSLPLKAHTSAHAETFVGLSEMTPSVLEQIAQDIYDKTLIIKENLFYDSKIRFSIFQPPRFS